MSKTVKTTLCILFLAIVGIICVLLFFGAVWNGAFSVIQPKEIATYNHPDKNFSLVFEQMGDPQWPFGATDIRLTLKNREGETIKSISAQLSDDGANAGEHNIASILWQDDKVIVVLRASEMKDKEIILTYN